MSVSLNVSTLSLTLGTLIKAFMDSGDFSHRWNGPSPGSEVGSSGDDPSMRHI